MAAGCAVHRVQNVRFWLSGAVGCRRHLMGWGMVVVAWRSPNGDRPSFAGWKSSSVRVAQFIGPPAPNRASPGPTAGWLLGSAALAYPDLPVFARRAFGSGGLASRYQRPIRIMPYRLPPMASTLSALVATPIVPYWSLM
jgi:hypothetical protein